MTFAGPCVIGATCAKFKLAANTASNKSPRNRRTAGRLRERCYQTERSGSISFHRSVAAVCDRRSAKADRILTFESRFALLFLSGSRFPMKTSFRLLAVVFALIAVNSVRAGDFVSQVVQAGATFTISVPGGRFLVIRNFTQEFSASTTVRGTVTATDGTGLTGTVLTATLADTNPIDLLEPINEVIIAGPSTVTVTGGDTNCFITYRKGQD
jgi:hypothetical protein